jgi:hypothetical protein
MDAGHPESAAANPVDVAPIAQNLVPLQSFFHRVRSAPAGSYSQALAAFGPAATQDCLTASLLVAGAKAMSALAAGV